MSIPYVDRGTAKLFWEETGNGEPLLLVMGLGYTSDMWYRIRPALAEGFRVVTFDNRGVGKSDVPDGPYPLTMLGDDAAAVLDAAGVDRAHILGVSLGGYVAQEFVLRHPQRARSLILGCSGAGGEGAVQPAPPVMDKLIKRGAMSAEEGIRVMVPHLYDAGTPRDRVEEDLEVRLRTYPSEKGYTAQLTGSFDWPGAEDRLGDIGIPTLVIHGENDELVPPANAKTLHQGIPDSRLVLLKNASHIFWTDQPEASLEAMGRFLEEVGADAH